MAVRRDELLTGVLLALAVSLEVASVVLSWGLEPWADTVLYAVYGASMAVAGALITRRHPRHPIGWLFLGSALLTAFASDACQGWALRAATEGWPGVTAAEVLASNSWLASGLLWILTFLLFPHGRLPGRRWRAVVWAGAVGVALAAPGWAVSPDRSADYSSGRNPLAVGWVPADALLYPGMTLVTAALVASAASVLVRLRRARGVERQQLKWFASAALTASVVLPLSFLLWSVTPVAAVLAALALTALPVVACLAILRHRLYDIDLIVDRTVVYGAVTIVLAAAYAGSTVLLGTTLGRGSGWVTAGATLIVAVAFRPLRDRVQDLVDRRFHRARHEAVRRMQGFLEELRAGRAAPEEVGSVLRDLTSDRDLDLLLFLPESELYVDLEGAPTPLDGVARPDGRERLPVERGGQPLAVVVHRGAPEDPALLRGVVQAGGLAIEIARLRVELRRQLAEVHASRARIVAAGLEERRRIERDLHDGAQQRLVSIGLALRHAQHQLGGAGHAGGAGAVTAAVSAQRTLDGALAEVLTAITELRELARGLPPAHLDAGLATAFRDLARRAPVPVRVDALPDRLDRGIEGAAWFIGCEGVTNAVKHARASAIALSAGLAGGRLVVTVSDDGVGGARPVAGSGLSGLADRVAALGGVLRIDSAPGAGTTLVAELPCAS